jgi:hypothetical protein
MELLEAESVYFRYTVLLSLVTRSVIGGERSGGTLHHTL